MTNSLYNSQNIDSFIANPAILAAKISLVAPVRAFLSNQGMTYTAVQYGAGGTAITIALTTGGTAGSEVVTVVGNAISIQVESGVTTKTQLNTAIAASAPAMVLITIAGTGAGTITAPLVATALAGVVNSVSSFVGNGFSSIVQTGKGEYTVTMQDSFVSCLGVSFQVQAAVAADLVPQVKSSDVLTSQTIVVTLLTGSAPADVAANAVLYFSALLNGSSVIFAAR